MKKLAYALGILVILFGLEASSVPMFLTHQGHVLQSDQTPVGGVVGVTFSIYVGAEANSPLWTENFDVTFDNGFYSVVLGDHTSLGAELFDGSNRYLGIALDGQPEFSPRSQMTTVPYAIRAGIAGSLDTSNGISVDDSLVIDDSGNWVGGNWVGGSITVPFVSNCSEAGTLRWNDGLEVCNGSDWEAVGSGGGGDLAVPQISSLDPFQIEPEEDVDIVINGSNLEDGGEAEIGSDGRSYTYGDQSQVTINTNGMNLSAGLYPVRFTNPSGLRATKTLEVDSAPYWEISDDLGIYADSVTAVIDVQAVDAEGDLEYVLVSGHNLPGSPVLENGVLTFDPDDISDPTEYTFTIRATDTANTPHEIEKTFTISVVDDCLGQSENAPSPSCKEIFDSNCSVGDGAYWIQPESYPDPFQVHCYMDLGGDVGGGWTLVFRTSTNDFGPFSSNTFLTGNWDGWSWTDKNQFDTIGYYGALGDENAYSPAYASVPFNDVMVIANRDSAKRVAWHHNAEVPSVHHAIITEPIRRLGDSCIEGICTHWIQSLDIRSDTTNSTSRNYNEHYGFKIHSDNHGASSRPMAGGMPAHPNGSTTTAWSWMQIGYGGPSSSSKDGHGFGAICSDGVYHRFNGHMWGWGSGRNSSAWSGDKSSPFYGHALYVR